MLKRLIAHMTNRRKPRPLGTPPTGGTVARPAPAPRGVASYIPAAPSFAASAPDSSFDTASVAAGCALFDAVTGFGDSPSWSGFDAASNSDFGSSSGDFGGGGGDFGGGGADGGW